MDSLLENNWYLKSSAKNPCVQGPYSTERMLRFLKEGRLKSRVCLSLDQRHWTSLEKLHAGHIANCREILLKAARERGKTPIRVLLVLAALSAMTIVFSFIFPWPKATPLTSYESGQNDSDILTMETRDVETKQEKDGEIRQAKSATATQRLAPKLPESSREVENLPPKPQSGDKQNAVFEEKGEENTANWSLAPLEKSLKLPQVEKKRVQAEVKQYYLHLDEITGQLSKRRDFEQAWQLFIKRVRTMEGFLRERGVSVSAKLLAKIRMENKDDERFGYFYPASLHESYRDFLIATDSEEMSAMEKQISDYQLQLANIIEAEKKLKRQKHTLKNTAELIEKMHESVQREIAQKNVELAASRKKIQKMRDILDAKREMVVKLSEKSLKWARQINELRKEIDPVPLGYYPSESWRQHQLKRDLQRLLDKQAENLGEMATMQKEILAKGEQILASKKSIPILEKKISILDGQLLTLQKQLDDVKPKLKTINNNLLHYEESLKPLKRLVQKKLQVAKVLRETEEWWHKSYPKPKKKFLQAIYVLKNFPDQYYRIEHRKNYGKGGVVEVHFW